MTDRAATSDVRNGGAGMFIIFPVGMHNLKFIPIETTCTSYRADIKALMNVANIKAKETFKIKILFSQIQEINCQI